MPLLLGTSLLLGALLTAAPREIPGIAAAIVLGGSWLSFVLAMTLPRPPRRATRGLLERLAEFRHALNAIGDRPSRAALERAIALVAELRLPDDEVAEEVAELRACIAAIELEERLSSGDVPCQDAPDPVADGDVCHFACPVRSGRRRSDRFGHLVLSRRRLEFRGGLDLSVAWSEIASVRRRGREIVVGLHARGRMLRFSCDSPVEAAKGGIIAEHLARASRIDASSRDAGYELSV